jgi:hypothetical protein
MPSTEAITFVVAVNRRDILENNFLASPCFRGSHAHQILLQENFGSAAKAYNDAIDRSVNGLIVFCHQDVFLPETWLPELQESLNWLEKDDPGWGVLGCSGITLDGRYTGYVYSSGLGVIGKRSAQPTPIQTLDEIVLIFRKSSGLRFDESLPHFHLYGADICLSAAKRRMKSYAISAFCIHNTYQPLVLPKEFYDCCEHVRKVWKDSLPIQTTCIRITRFNFPIYARRLREVYRKYIRRKEIGGTRVSNVQQLLEELADKT